MTRAIVDLFAGGGGASEGFRLALGRAPDVAINHWPLAIVMHSANHPRTRHLIESVFKSRPRDVVGDAHVSGLWASADCTHFSKAKGGKPRSKKIRSLAWAVAMWARDVRPDVIFLENVEEFVTWGPLGEDGLPCPRRKGKTFRAWIAKLRSYGYEVEWRVLCAADYGTPQMRYRLFVIARRDGRPIVWPEPTHGPGRPHPYRTAAEIIDWSLPCPSIFERKRPLAEATLRRIATGVRRYVIENARPFIVPLTHPRDARVHSIDQPLRTVTSAHRGELALIVPTLVQSGYGEREGQTPRALDINAPLGTVVAGGQKHRLVAALLTKHYGGVIGHEIDRPASTITTQDHHALSVAFLTKYYGTSIGADVRDPLPTVTSGGGRGGGHLAEVRALLQRFAPAQQSLGGDLPLVRVDGIEYVIADIGSRMLQPHELFAAQGFPTDYNIAPEVDGKPITKTAQVALCGNAVPPQIVAAIVRANLADDARSVAA